MKNDFHIVIIPGGEVWFQEIAETLLYGLRRLGHPAEIAGFGSGTNIVLAAHLAKPEAIPDGAILYNFEQMGVGAPGLPLHLYQVGQRCAITGGGVWEYSANHLPLWEDHGVPARHVELGYVPELTRIWIADCREDIDVLFYGSQNHRRLQVMRELERAGARVVNLSRVFGAARDEQIARAKIVLNMHYYESRTFEIARVFYLLANRRAVVTESSSDEADYAYLADGMVSVPYEGLAEACMQLLEDPERCEELRATGFDRFAQRSETEILRTALSS